MLSNLWSDLRIRNLTLHLKNPDLLCIYTTVSLPLHVTWKMHRTYTKKGRKRWGSWPIHAASFLLSPFNRRCAGDQDSFNNIAYFFSAFLKNNLLSVCLPTVPIFCHEWERSIVCVKWIIAQEAGAAKRVDEHADQMEISESEKFKGILVWASHLIHSL